MSDEKWLEQAEELVIFKGGNRQNESLQLLNYSQTNRTIYDGEQAQALILLRLAYIRFSSLYSEKSDSENSWKWVSDVADMIEQYQLTMAGEDNSRRQFMKVFIAQMANRLRQWLGKEVRHIQDD